MRDLHAQLICVICRITIDLRLLLICAFLLSSLTSCSKEPAGQQARPPNILFIMTDDHAARAISAYGSKINETPNIDELAAEGLLFRNAFVTNSICASSRAVILTGLYSHLNGVRDNETAFDSAQLTFPELLRANGYETAIVGKWHLRSQPSGFDYWNVLPDQGDYYNPAFIDNGKDTVYEGYVTDLITEKSLEWLSARKSEKPFMLMIHHKAPHRNWMPALRHLDVYDNDSFPIPVSFNDDYQGREHLIDQQLTVAEHMSRMYDLKIPCDTCTEAPINRWTPGAYRAKMNRLTDEQRAAWENGYQEEINEFKSLDHNNKQDLKQWKLRRYLQDYLRCIMAVDESIGAVHQYLKENDLAENTLVVYTSDQGFFLGEHRLFDKRYMYEESFQTPLIMKFPGRIEKGVKSEVWCKTLTWRPLFWRWPELIFPGQCRDVLLFLYLNRPT